MASTIVLKRGEAKTLKFTFKDSSGNPKNVSSATFTFALRAVATKKNALTKTHQFFNVTNAADGIIKITILSTDTEGLKSGVYIGEIKTEFSNESCDISDNIPITLEESLFTK